MTQSIYDRYLENEVLSADPAKLVTILYRAAIEAVAGARINVRNGEIRDRSRRIVKASDIVHELLHTLNHSEGGALSQNLAALYAYMHARLMEANSTQTEQPLAEVETLLRTLLEGWTEATAQLTAAAPAHDDLLLAQAR